MEQLKLDNQLCFPFYTVSRMIIRRYQPLLDELKLTYPQYLVMLVLWESDEQPVNDIAKRLYLQTNTVTPLLKRMEADGLIERAKASRDERKVIISLTAKGQALKTKAETVPFQLFEGMDLSLEEAQSLHRTLYSLIDRLK